jgi:prepilin-type N-terminal cleavage/methylation domain-containing protein
MQANAQNTPSAGFTLVELMIVVVIVGILAALAIPKFQTTAYRAKEKEADSILKQIYTLQQAYRAEFGAFASTASDLEHIGFQVPGALQHYVWNPQVGNTVYCLAADPPGTSHQDRCVDLDSGMISDRT